MYPLICMAIALALLVLLLRLRVKIGRAMLCGAIALSILLKVRPGQLWYQLTYEWHNQSLSQTTAYLFVTLSGLLLLVNVLGLAMKRTGVTERLVPALNGLFKSRRVALAAIPLMMGLLPTPGGIMLSAPMVKAPGDAIGISRGRLAAINLLFRHQWEPIWPLFPAIPLIQGMLGISAWQLLSHNIILTAAGILSGSIFLLMFGIPKKDRNSERPKRHIFENLRDFAGAFWPIVVTITLYAAFDLPPAVGIFAAIVLFLLRHKVAASDWLDIFKKAAEPDHAVLVFGALLFKLNLQAAGAIPEVVQFMSSMHIPTEVLIFVLPFMVSFLTGLTMPTVAITYPLFMEFFGTGADANLGLQTLAFCGIVCALQITPIHLCLALSCSYFEVGIQKILIRMLPVAICTAAAGILAAIFLG